MASTLSYNTTPFDSECVSYLDGTWYFNTTKLEHLAGIKDFEVDDEDIYLCGFMKSGNVWMSTIIRAILNKDDLASFERTQLIHSTNMLDFKFEIASKQPHPGLFLSHLRYECLPRDISKKEVKIIYIIRNPKDVAVSYFYFTQVFKPFGPWKGDWNVFIKAFLSGNIVYGSWFDHAKSYFIHHGSSNILFVKYEELKQNTRFWVEKMAGFLERPLDQTTLDRIVHIVHFENMKKNPYMTVKDDPLMTTGSEFMRKGIIGDWKTLFTEEQSREVDEKLRLLCEETGCGFYMI